MPSTLFLPPRHFLTLFSLSRMSTMLPTQESHTLQSAFPSFSRTNDQKKKKKQETCSQIICLDFSSGPWVRCLSYTPHGVKEIHRIDLFFLFLLLLFFFFTLLFVIIVSGEQRRDSAIHIHVSILPQTPLCPVCQVTLSRVPCALQ